jgi:HAD superfamily hydrolase (TIGR01459 family)
MSSSAEPLLLEKLEPLAPRYDLILCDVWGVLHNGEAAYPAASHALMRFREGGGKVVLISNAPRPGDSVSVHLDQFGVPREAYDAIVTSGDLTRSAVEERAGQVVHHMGPPRDLPIFEGLDVTFGSIAEAEYVVCSGFDDDGHETVDDYRERLSAMRARRLPMICANPDLIVERGHEILPCAGALALVYEEEGGEVFYAGKPHLPIYERATAIAEAVKGSAISKTRILAIGDAIRTDVAGAKAFGVDVLLLARGIHAEELGLHRGPLQSQHVQDWISRQTARPMAVMDALTWAV